MPAVALVTGANQGLGFALVQALSRALPADSVVYLTARDPVRGQAAVDQLAANRDHAVFLQLDVTSDASVAQAAERIRSRHGGVDILFSNAAARITRDRPQAEQVAAFIDTNNHGTYRIIRAFGPLLRDHARFLVVASSFGLLSRLPSQLHPLFDVGIRSLEDIEALMDRYVSLVQAGRERDEGWPEWINVPSKVAQVASMKIFARQMHADAMRRGILIDAVCPGLVDTDASRPWFEDMSAAQSPETAAVDPVWLALRPPGTTAPYGEIVRHREIMPWQ